ncbi:hypothetical protein FQN60_002814 [Etheostoma spectabile]|uniref:Vacuolar-sorting protein SNF8 n=1 Tax=Etheostoma spectabile TaxID=54343 RepID=A0A5J5CKF1_9PERO|nr:hypothetical protein FQN60_002814 [Etheostoma spectabile]
MHRRGVGAGAIAKKKLAEAKYKERGTVLAEDQIVQEFASKHKQEIRKNSQFRVQFQEMCATIGMLGVGDFYYELGLITLDELHQRVLKGRGKFAQDVSQDDLMRAIKKLKVMGNGFGMIPVGGSYLVQSVPAELNMDHTVVLQLAEKKGYVSVGEIKDSLKWEKERACHVLAPGEAQYWLPALFSEITSRDVTPEEANQMTP